MRSSEPRSTNEKVFEPMPETSVSDLLPADTAKEALWTKAKNRIFIGMALSVGTLNFLRLQYILPAVGILLSLLGFRILRRENNWFRACFILTVMRAASFFTILVLNTTILPNSAPLFPAASVLTAVYQLLLPVDLFCLLRGLSAMQSLFSYSGSIAALIVWYVLLYALTAAQYNGFMIAGTMLIGYILILRRLYFFSKELDKTVHSIQPAFIKVSDRCIVLVLLSILFIGCALGYFFGGSYPMQWNAVGFSEPAETAAIKSHLVQLGFPEYVLNDLTPEDIAACDGALRVAVDVTDKPVNKGRTVTTEYSNNARHYVEQKTVYDVNELRITGVGVQVPGDPEKWIIFHHFLWAVSPKFYGTESIQLWPVYRDISDGWASDGDVTGRVLFDKNGETFAAPYYFLGNQTFASNNIFWGEQMQTDIFAAFSMPQNGENHRGYIAYPITEMQDDYIISSCINYTHQRNWFQYPAMTAMEKRMSGSWNDAGAFITVQDALQFYPTNEGIEIIGGG